MDAALLTALRKYGQHRPECEGFPISARADADEIADGYGSDPDVAITNVCTCGLLAAIAEAESK